MRLLLLAILIFATAATDARSIDVSTIPQRDSVQLTIYNSVDLTLVRETRAITFKPGLNPLQFSWANTLIDPSSVELRFLDQKEKLEVFETSYPHDRPQLLEWVIESELDGAATVEVTYFTSGISWAADYVCIADTTDTTMSFDGFVRITNDSGEEYRDAQVRLVVGEINLVELISDLAAQGILDKAVYLGADINGGMSPGSRDRLYSLMKARMEQGGGTGGGGSLFGDADDDGNPKEILKETLSDYFIYSIEGTETIPTGWSKRLRLFTGLEAPISVEYRWRPAEYGEQLARLFILRNDEASQLGSTPLPDGTVRLFRDNGRDGLSFLMSQWIDYVPIGQEIVLNLGTDPEVIHERLVLGTAREEFWFQSGSPMRYFSPAAGDRIEPAYEVAGWNQRIRIVERIRNYRPAPIKVQVRLSVDGDAIFESAHDPVLFDVHSPQFDAVVPPGAVTDLAYTVIQRLGINKKQERVELRKEVP